MSELHMSSATVRATSLSLYIPSAGAWRADVTLESGDAPAIGSKVTLTCGDLSFVGAVLRADLDAAGKPHAVVVGGLGWQSLVAKPISFQSDVGVRLSTVLTAIAANASEGIVKPTDRTIGDYYEIIASRDGSPVRWLDVLNDLSRNGFIEPWRVDPDGITRFGARASSNVSVRATLMHRDAAAGVSTYGVDSPGQFLPGNVIVDPATGATTPISRAMIREEGGKLEVDVYTTDEKAPPSIKDQIRRMLRDELDSMIRTYVVATVHADGRVDLVPPPESPHMPEIKNAEPWTSGGMKFEAPAGTEVSFAFLDNQKTKPRVLGFKLSGGPFAGVARLGDTVTVLLPPATFSGLITISGTPSPASGMVTWPAQTTGTITTSSAKSKAGP